MNWLNEYTHKKRYVGRDYQQGSEEEEYKTHHNSWTQGYLGLQYFLVTITTHTHTPHKHTHTHTCAYTHALTRHHSYTLVILSGFTISSQEPYHAARGAGILSRGLSQEPTRCRL